MCSVDPDPVLRSESNKHPFVSAAQQHRVESLKGRDGRPPSEVSCLLLIGRPQEPHQTSGNAA